MVEAKHTASTKPYPSPESLVTGSVQVKWDEEPSVEITLPGIPFEDAGIWGYLTMDSNGNKVMKAGSVVVPEQLEGYHLGEKLLRSFATEAVTRGCRSIEADFRHPASLKACLAIFGYDRIHFEDTTRQAAFFPTDEQAIMERLINNWRAWDQRRDPSHRLADTPMMATIDLTGLNTVR